MARRHDARRLAAVVLYQAEVGGADPQEILAERRNLGEGVPRFTEELVLGVVEHRSDIDVLLQRHAREWTLDRMPALDRTLLRLACFELLYREDVPAAVAIDEAVAAAKELSTEDSSRFVNGVLGEIARERAGA